MTELGSSAEYQTSEGPSTIWLLRWLGPADPCALGRGRRQLAKATQRQGEMEHSQAGLWGPKPSFLIQVTCPAPDHVTHVWPLTHKTQNSLDTSIAHNRMLSRSVREARTCDRAVTGLGSHPTSPYNHAPECHCRQDNGASA